MKKKKTEQPEESIEEQEPQKSPYENQLQNECKAAIAAYKKYIKDSKEEDRFSINKTRNYLGPLFLNLTIYEILEPSEKPSWIAERIYDTLFPPAKNNIKTEGLNLDEDITLVSHIPRPDFE